MITNSATKDNIYQNLSVRALLSVRQTSIVLYLVYFFILFTLQGNKLHAKHHNFIRGRGGFWSKHWELIFDKRPALTKKIFWFFCQCLAVKRYPPSIRYCLLLLYSLPLRLCFVPHCWSNHKTKLEHFCTLLFFMFIL